MDLHLLKFDVSQTAYGNLSGAFQGDVLHENVRPRGHHQITQDRRKLGALRDIDGITTHQTHTGIAAIT